MSSLVRRDVAFGIAPFTERSLYAEARLTAAGDIGEFGVEKA